MPDQELFAPSPPRKAFSVALSWVTPPPIRAILKWATPEQMPAEPVSSAPQPIPVTIPAVRPQPAPLLTSPLPKLEYPMPARDPSTPPHGLLWREINSKFAVNIAGRGGDAGRTTLHVRFDDGQYEYHEDQLLERLKAWQTTARTHDQPIKIGLVWRWLERRQQDVLLN